MSRSLIGVAILLGIQLLGTLVSHFVIPIMPGSVIGMILLFLLLQCGLVKEIYLEGLVRVLIENMTLFFLPSAVGIITILPLVGDNILSIGLSVVLSTILVLLCVGLCQQFFDKGNKEI
ncbi:MAG: CidA/LrgA family protein [Rikenellaceae bacterium]